MARSTKKTSGPLPTPPDAATVVAAASSAPPFPVVGVGASAGGLAPFLELLRHIPPSPGMAIVFILHSDKHNSVLPAVVARATALPVLLVEDGMAVETDHIYIAPPGMVVTLENACFAVRDRGTDDADPIDAFFRSLAMDQTTSAVGVVLSGSGSDGTLGTLAIRAESGFSYVQDDTAEFHQMPRSAVRDGAVDLVLAPEALAMELINVARNSLTAAEPQRLHPRELTSIVRLLHAARDIDFGQYKPATIERRILRRMALHKLEAASDYITLLRDDPAEAEQLCGDILIRVTGFFRDPEVFEALQRDILPRIVEDRSDASPVRVWVPGCATGEEVYSLAMAFAEVAEKMGGCPIQIFGTDLSDEALDRARSGIYPDTLAADVSPERLRRFFTKVEEGYRVAKSVRDCCVFARQNLTRDPPFSRLDLVSCRNVLIYLGGPLQRKVMSIFHYALRPQGYLLLGSSETIGTFGDLFSPVDRRHKIYRRTATAPNRLTVDFEPSSGPLPARARAERPPMPEQNAPPPNVFREADRVMLARLAPPGVLINESMEIIQFRGRTSSYLEPPSGAASFNILKMVREGLLADLRAAIHTARKSDDPVRREGIRVKANGDFITVDLEVIPFTTPQKERYQLVLFHDAGNAAAESPRTDRQPTLQEQEGESRTVTRLKRELEATREYLQSIIEEQEAMNEELRSANEEIQSSNEELQSTNEELETAKEELQSSNEELITLNEELERGNEELAEVNNDLVNLLASIDVSIVILDAQLRIRRFNPPAQRVLGLIGADVGRPIQDVNSTLLVDGLDRMIERVIDDLEVLELEVKDRRGGAHLLRIRPYRTVENRIEGAVLVLIDIDQLRKR
ncbi:MAG TPA: CheR family methyltransferase [Thermoanaerobaculia bacterium]|nr:CheR family methyltransferase [Thermoanaerobaculia bacterium]